VRTLMPATAAQPAMANVVEQVTEPFAPTQFLDATPTAHAAVHHANWLPLVLLAVWACGALVVAFRFGRGWLKVYAAKRAAQPIELAADVPVMCTPALMDPGIFGIARPVLILPEGILNRLTAEQLRVIVVHEMCHVKRRDNLTFAVHMVVETLFWFHPAVCWIGAQLIDERERACDEAVAQAGVKAEVYAEGILSVCKFFAESPLACVSGVTGADLKKRIVRIMAEQVARKLSLSRKLALAVVGTLTLTTPLMLGLVRAQSDSQGAAGWAEIAFDITKLPKFDVVSIKPHKDEGMKMRVGVTDTPDGFTAGGLPMRMLIRQAFGVSDDRVLNEPDWTRSARYDIQAKVAPEDASKFNQLTDTQQWQMLVPVLEERCALKFHHETRRLTVYTLEVAKGGVKMQLAKAPEAATAEPGQRGTAAIAGMSIGDNGLTMTAHGATMALLSHMISMQIGSTVIDKTGLTGSYDYTLQFAPDENMLAGMRPPPSGDGAPPPEAQSPSIFAALQEQIGLKLELKKEPVDVIVIDHIEQPTTN
jgi:bla regulator protein blaR1